MNGSGKNVMASKFFTLLIKPAGLDCNLACKYCFYSDKTNIFGRGTHRMSDELLERLIQSYMNLGFEMNNFAWQGGEPTLMGLDFYKKVIELQQKYGKAGQIVCNALQTNGILFDQSWCEFLHKYKFLVGISLDGPKELHDFYRRDHSGFGTFYKVMAGMDACRKSKVEFNILVLLNNKNVTQPDELFDFFVAEKVKFLQFVPCVEKNVETGKITDFSITPQQYGDFLCRIFDRWYELGTDKLSIRLFDSILSYCLNHRHTLCTFGYKCDDYVVVEHNGDVFCCDFFVEQEWKIGNIFDSPIDRLAGSEVKRKFANQKQEMCNQCLVCRYVNICRGGCLKDRILGGAGFKHQSYFCRSYRQFFDYSLAKFMQIAARFSIPYMK